MSNQYKAEQIAEIEEEAYQEWLNQPPIQFLLCPDSPIKNFDGNNNSSQVGNGGKETGVGMNDLLWEMTSMDAMLLDEFHDNEIGCDDHISHTFFEMLKSTSTTRLFGPG